MTIKPTIVIDQREQLPLIFENLPSEAGTLQSADYSIKGMEHLFGVERKGFDDAVSSLTTGRDRFERELHRLRGFRFKRLLIIGDPKDLTAGNYRSKASPAALVGSLHAFEIRYDIPVVWAPNPTEAARLVETWAHYFTRQAIKDAECAGKSPSVSMSRKETTPAETVSPLRNKGETKTAI